MISNKLRQEIFALVEYCKIYEHDIDAFDFGDKVECPDLQSKILDIGIECTNALPKDKSGQSGELKMVGVNSKANNIAGLTVFSYWIHSATDPHMLLDCVRDKTKKLNGHYKLFGTNALFMHVSSLFSGSQHFSIRNAEEFATELDRASICGKVKFNPIVLSQLETPNSTLCFAVDTSDCSITEHHVSLSLSKNEGNKIKEFFELQTGDSN